MSSFLILSGKYSAPVSYSAAVLLDSPLRYWKLNEPSGATALESISSSNGTYTGGYTLGATGISPSNPSAVILNGSTGYISAPNVSVSTDISVECWSNYSSSSQNGILVNKETVNQNWLIFLEGGFLKWRGVGTTVNISAPAPSINQWHHFVATQSNLIAKLYIDGQLVASDQLPAAIGNTVGTINIGRYNSGYYYNGTIAHVAIYPTVLSQPQIFSHYRAVGETGAIRSTQLPQRTIIAPSTQIIRSTQLPQRTLVATSTQSIRSTQLPQRTLVATSTQSVRSTQVAIRVLYVPSAIISRPQGLSGSMKTMESGFLN